MCALIFMIYLQRSLDFKVLLSNGSFLLLYFCFIIFNY